MISGLMVVRKPGLDIVTTRFYLTTVFTGFSVFR